MVTETSFALTGYMTNLLKVSLPGVMLVLLNHYAKFLPLLGKFSFKI